MQKFYISTLTLTKSGCKYSAELHFAKFIINNNITKLVSKCAGRINEQLLKTSDFDVLSSMEKLPKKTLTLGLLYARGLNSNSPL